MKLLKAGNFKLLYHAGCIRRISYGNQHIVRMIYFAFRDENWATLDNLIAEESIKETERSFEVRFSAKNSKDDELMKWNCVIIGDTTGKISFNIDGTVLKDSLRNRIGFCILHPLRDVVGTQCRVKQPDGQVTEGKFPTLIDPENPFKNIREMEWRIGDNWYRLTFGGDVFETEDQRNYGDGSFKTFCTPSKLPIPVAIKKGETISQEVTFEAAQPLKAPTTLDVVVITAVKKKCIFPKLGVCASTETSDLSASAISLLKKLKLNHYRVEVDSSQTNWVAQFSQDCTNAYSLGLPLELALHLSKNFDNEIESVMQLCKQNRIKIHKVLLISKDEPVTSRKLIRRIPSMKNDYLLSAVGAGTNYNFTEVNNNRFSDNGFDFLAFGYHPQEHLTDDLTVIDNIEACEFIARTANEIAGQKSVHVSPVTLRRRFNPYAKDESEKVKSNAQKADPRQMLGFTAAWTLGVLSSFAAGGADAITLFQTVGRQGLISEDGNAYPVFNLLSAISQYQGQTVTPLTSARPNELNGLMFEDGTVAIANYTNAATQILIEDKSIAIGVMEVRWLKLF